ncbi:MAG: NAD(P)-dependent oxidoreductase [Acidobacteriota bacterium]|nr:NAD(P)-dependent oxidoreductase [Acidobacteriota bacterium]
MKKTTFDHVARGAALLCIFVSAASVPAGEVQLPEGIALGERDDGRNLVHIEVGSESVFVDALFFPLHQAIQRPKFMVQTGAGDGTVFPESHISLVPDARASSTSKAPQTSVTVRSGFTMAHEERQVVILNLGRCATAADSVVWLPHERTLITGRLCDRSGVAATSDSDTDAWRQALYDLLDLEPTTVVPGRGAPGGPELLAGQLDRLTNLRSHIDSSLRVGATQAQSAASYDAPWFKAWRAGAADEAKSAFEAVYAEVGGLQPPWPLMEDRRLREGPSPTRDSRGWTKPRRVLWRNSWPDRLPMLSIVAPGVEIVPFDTTQEALEMIDGADALIGTANGELLTTGEGLRWVQVGSAGVERYLKIPKLASGEVLLTNGQRLASQVIAEHVMALTRALARGLNRAVAAQNEGQWQRREIGDSAPLTSLRGKTMLVVGLGGIGTEVARLADAAGMRVTAIRNSRRSGPPFVASVGLGDDLPTYANEADVVVNCLPMTPDTADVFDAGLFAVMKPTAFFINVGRGGTVDTDALVAALVNGRIAGAGLDVTDPEPLPENHPLWNAPNLIITPHFAAWSDDDSNLRWLLYRENLRRFAAGEELLSVVDPKQGY